MQKKAASADEAGQKQQQAGTPRKRSKNSTQVAESPVSSEKATPEDAKVDAAAQLREAFDEVSVYGSSKKPESTPTKTAR